MNENKENIQNIVDTYADDMNYWEYCDNCGEKLIGRKCKLICPKCGFFRSCSEP
jgi:hypothetical protein